MTSLPRGCPGLSLCSQFEGIRHREDILVQQRQAPLLVEVEPGAPATPTPHLQDEGFLWVDGVPPDLPLGVLVEDPVLLPALLWRWTDGAPLSHG